MGIGKSKSVWMSAGDMSGSLASTALRMENVSLAAIQAIYTGSPAGTLKLQGSCDPCEVGEVPTHWTDITGASTVVAAADSWIFNLTAPGFRWLRVVWTPSSGTGALTLNVQTKGGF